MFRSAPEGSHVLVDVAHLFSRGDMRLTQEQWKAVEPLVQPRTNRTDRRGRPWRDARSVLDAILWTIRHGCAWKSIPSELPPYQTCHRRFQTWLEDGTFLLVIEALLHDLDVRGGIDIRWVLTSRPDSTRFAEALTSLRPAGRRGRPGWRTQTLETLLAPKMVRVLAPIYDAAIDDDPVPMPRLRQAAE